MSLVDGTKDPTSDDHNAFPELGVAVKVPDIFSRDNVIGTVGFTKHKSCIFINRPLSWRVSTKMKGFYKNIARCDFHNSITSKLITNSKKLGNCTTFVFVFTFQQCRKVLFYQRTFTTSVVISRFPAASSVIVLEQHPVQELPRLK